MEKIKKTMNDKKTKRWGIIACTVFLIGWVIFRFAAVASENARYVFNPARAAADAGQPVLTITAQMADGIIRDPIAVRDNRAYVSAEHARKLYAGQKVGNGKITSVSKNVDLNTGMYIVRTSGVADGLQYAEFPGNGYFIPTYAVNNDKVMVISDGVATVRNVYVARSDSENAYITTGLKNGDIVILSKVADGTKVQVSK